jgi:transposase-like protein
MKHYSAERKAAVLQKMLPPTSLSVAELAKQEGISDVTLYHWRKQAMASGAMSAVTKKTTEGWSAESKLAAVVETALLSEVELSEYCREKGLYPDQVKAWKQACISPGTTMSIVTAAFASLPRHSVTGARIMHC